MKAIVNTGPNRLEWLDLPLPQPGPGQVRIRTGACGICATDLQMIAGWQRTPFPAIPGHEWSGRVDAVGPDVGADWVGRSVVADNVLADGGEVGFEHTGGYASYFLTEAACLRALPDAFPLPAATLIEPLAVCVRGMRRLAVEDHRAALVVGDGPIGLLMSSLLRLARVERIVLVGGRPARLQLARELGAEAVLNYHEAKADLTRAALALVPGGAPNVVEASGTEAGIRLALASAAPGARVLVLGDYADRRADFPWNMLLHRQLRLIGSNASAGAWDEAVHLAAIAAVPLQRLVSRTVPAAAFAAGIDLVRNSRDAVKVVLTWA